MFFPGLIAIDVQGMAKTQLILEADVVVEQADMSQDEDHHLLIL